MLNNIKGKWQSIYHTVIKLPPTHISTVDLMEIKFAHPFFYYSIIHFHTTKTCPWPYAKSLKENSIIQQQFHEILHEK